MTRRLHSDLLPQSQSTEVTGARLRPGLARAAAALWVLAAAWYVLAEAVAARAFPGYSYAHNYISDLGVLEVGDFDGRYLDSPLAALMNSAFIVHGVLFAAAGVLLARAVPPTRGRSTFVVLSLVHGVGIALVGTFHASQTSVEAGTIAFHFGGATLAIVGGNLAVLTAARLARRLGAPRVVTVTSRVLGVAGLMGLLLLIANSVTTGSVLSDDGVWERLSVYTIMAWEVFAAVVVLRALARHR